MRAILVTPAPGKANRKVGPIPVSTTTADSCPRDCPFRGNGCYGEGFPLSLNWQKVTDGRRGVGWRAFCSSVAALPAGQLWRHNQAGDLPRKGRNIDASKLRRLVAANAGRRGYTYTHHSMDVPGNVDAVKSANAQGFTINLSANTPADADRLAALEAGPVVAVMPRDCAPLEHTPAGRKIVQCPATYKDAVNCASCGLCAIAGRTTIIGFPAHGNGARRAEAVAKG